MPILRAGDEVKGRQAAQKRWCHRSIEVTSGRVHHARLAVIADTHSRPHPKSQAFVRAIEPDAILHAGDIGDVSVLDDFEAIAPLIAVRGNIDGHDRFSDSVDLRVLDAEQHILCTLLLQHICVYGPKLRADAAKNAKTHNAQIVVCGHSHVPFIGQDKGLWVFNPGSIGPRRFALPIVFGVIEFGPGGVRMHHVSCETGQRWTP